MKRTKKKVLIKKKWKVKEDSREKINKILSNAKEEELKVIRKRRKRNKEKGRYETVVKEILGANK